MARTRARTASAHGQRYAIGLRRDSMSAGGVSALRCVSAGYEGVRGGGDGPGLRDGEGPQAGRAVVRGCA